MKKYLFFVLCSLFILNSCSNEGIDLISETTLNGKIFGEDFVYTQGYAEVSESEFIKIVLTSSEINCTSEVHSLPLYLSVAIPDRVGFHKNVYAVFGKSGQQPVREIDAVVELIEVNSTEVTGKIRSTNSKNNKVEGMFSVQRCAR